MTERSSEWQPQEWPPGPSPKVPWPPFDPQVFRVYRCVHEPCGRHGDAVRVHPLLLGGARAWFQPSCLACDTEMQCAEGLWQNPEVEQVKFMTDPCVAMAKGE